MIILAIETTGPLASVAIFYDENTIKEKINDTQYSHLEEIVPMVKSIFHEQGLSKADINAIAVSRGPGSFTGIRIGMATAKALAQVWEIPLIAVPTLKSFAYGAGSESKRVICPIFDARRSQIYAAAYRRSGKRVETLIEEGAYETEYFLKLLQKNNQSNEKVTFYGDGIHVYQDQLSRYEGLFELSPEGDRFQKASRIAVLGSNLFLQGIVTDAFHAKPEYLRIAEAERKLLKK